MHVSRRRPPFAGSARGCAGTMELWCDDWNATCRELLSFCLGTCGVNLGLTHVHASPCCGCPQELVESGRFQFPCQRRAYTVIFRETRALHGRDDVGLSEVVSFEKKRLASEFGEGIGEAVTEIEPRRMAALAEVVEGLAREMRLLNRHRFDHNANATKQCVTLLGGLNAELTLDDNREFDEIPGGYTTARSVADGLDIEFRIRLFRQDGDER